MAKASITGFRRSRPSGAAGPGRVQASGDKKHAWSNKTDSTATVMTLAISTVASTSPSSTLRPESAISVRVEMAIGAL